MSRWIATIYYLSDAGIVDVDHDFEEIEELHDIVERGPDWHTIDRIVVRLAQRFDKLTIEQAEKI
jgi:hypothetical protein